MPCATNSKAREILSRIAGPLLKASPRERLKWLLLTVLFSAAAVSAEVAFYNNFRFAWDRQTLKCLDANVLLVSLKDKTPKRGAVFAYTSRQAAPVVPEGMLMGKILTGLPGDTVEVRRDNGVYVNDVKVAQGMPHLRGLKPSETDRFYGKRTLKADEYWMTGTKPLSFDSRYWGPIKGDQIYGRAYALF